VSIIKEYTSKIDKFDCHQKIKKESTVPNIDDLLAGKWYFYG
jgi:hypothetical protein